MSINDGKQGLNAENPEINDSPGACLIQIFTYKLIQTMVVWRAAYALKWVRKRFFKNQNSIL